MFKTKIGQVAKTTYFFYKQHLFIPFHLQWAYLSLEERIKINIKLKIHLWHRHCFYHRSKLKLCSFTLKPEFAIQTQPKMFLQVSKSQHLHAWMASGILNFVLGFKHMLSGFTNNPEHGWLSNQYIAASEWLDPSPVIDHCPSGYILRQATEPSPPWVLRHSHYLF